MNRRRPHLSAGLPGLRAAGAYGAAPSALADLAPPTEEFRVTVADDAFVHPSAELEDDVTIGARTRVWRGAHVRRHAVVGEDAQLGANVFVDEGVSVGNRVKVQNNVSVYKGVTLEDDVFVGPAAVFTNDLNPRATGDWVLTPTMLRRGASVGANATVVCGHELGEHCLVAAGAVVTRDVAPHQLVQGNPARPAGWVCRCGAVVSRAAERPADLDCAVCPHGAN